MNRPRIKKLKKKDQTDYVIDPNYIKAKMDLQNALNSESEYILWVDYCKERGATEYGLIRDLHSASVEMCLKSVRNYEKWPNVLIGSPFLSENGYRDDLLDDFY